MADQSRTLKLKILGDAKSAIGALDKTQGKLGKLGKAASTVQGPLMVAGGAIAGAVFQFGRLGDEVQKMASRTGFSTEALSELRFAAEQSGTSLSGLEAGVRRMQRSISDAEAGLSTQVRALGALGVSLDELRGKAPEQQFELLAEAVARLEDPTMRAARAQEVFGRQGTMLLPLFEQGVEGMKALREQAHDLGIVMDQETANKAARMNDAVNTAKQSLNAIAFDIGSSVAPAVSTIAEAFAKMPAILQKITIAAGVMFAGMKAGILSTKSALISTGIGAAFLVIGEVLSRVTGQAKKLNDETERMRQYLERSAASLQNSIDAQEKHRAKLYDTRRELDEGSEEWERYSLWIATTEGRLDQLRSALSLIDLRDHADSIDAATRATDRLAQSTRKLTSAELAAAIATRFLEAEEASSEEERVRILHSLDEQIIRMQRLMAREQRLAEIIDHLTGANRELAPVLDTVTRSMGGAADGADAATDSIDKMGEAASTALPRLSALADAVRGAFAQRNQELGNIAGMMPAGTQLSGDFIRRWLAAQTVIIQGDIASGKLGGGGVTVVVEGSVLGDPEAIADATADALARLADQGRLPAGA